MKRGLVIAFGLLLSIGGCRALVGIDDLDFTPPLPEGGKGREGGNGGPNENENENEGGGPGPTAPPDAALAESCKTQGQECRRCCKNASSILHDTFEGTGPGAQCICDKGNCSSPCMVEGKCTPGQLPTSTPGTPDQCVLCVDQVLSSQAGLCNDACKGNPDCLAAVKCLQSCPLP